MISAMPQSFRPLNKGGTDPASCEVDAAKTTLGSVAFHPGPAAARERILQVGHSHGDSNCNNQQGGCALLSQVSSPDKPLLGMYGPPPSCKRKMSLAVGLRQCIRPLVESMTPGLDGHPLAFAPINWTVWLGPFPRAGSESVGSTHCHLSPQANREGTVFLDRDFRWTPVGSIAGSQTPERGYRSVGQ